MLSNKKVSVMLNNGNTLYSYVHLTYDYIHGSNNYIGVILNPTDILIYPDSETEIVFESQSRYLNSVLIHNIRDYRAYSQSYFEPSSYEYCKLHGTNIYLRKELHSGMIMDMPLIRSQPDNKIIMLLSHTPYNRDTVVSFRHSERNIIPSWAINNMRDLLDSESDITNPLYFYTRHDSATLVTISFQSNDNDAINSLREILSNYNSGVVPFFDSTNTNSGEFSVSFFVFDSTSSGENNITNFILMCKLLNVRPTYVTVQLNINEDDITQFVKIDQLFEITDMVD